MVNGEMYHVFNRGVEKRTVFMDKNDYQRFLHSINEFNSTIATENVLYRNSYEVQPRKEEPMVSVLAYTLLPNHFHLLLRQERDNGISDFMRKLGTGYTMYFNKKRERVGALFQGRFRSSLIDRSEYFQYISHYIHLNVLDVTHPGWKECSIPAAQAFTSLMNYEWSSAQTYLGARTNDYILDSSLIKELFSETIEYKKEIEELLHEPSEINNIAFK